MNKKGQFGAGFMALAAMFVIMIVIVVTLILVRWDTEAAQTVTIRSYQVPIVKYFLLSILKDTVDENLNMADLVSLGLENQENFERLGREIEKRFDGSDLYYSFEFGSGDFEEGSIAVDTSFKIIREGWSPKDQMREAYSVIPEHNGKYIEVTFNVGEGVER